MRTALFSNKTDENTDKILYKTGEKRFEWLIFKAFLTFFIILVAAQTALLYPSVRSTISDYYIEGEPLMFEAYLFKPCKMELKLINMSKCGALKILVNGMERAAFDSNVVLLELKDSDVVELDASSVPVTAKVQITAVSENITEILGKVISASDGIIPVTNVKVSN